MSWRIKVYDNFHYMDEEEAYWLEEEFLDEESAVARAQSIVLECCRDANFDFQQYAAFGDDPLVVSPSDHPRCEFSGRDYARVVCAINKRKDSPPER